METVYIKYQGMAKQMAIQSINPNNINIALATNSMHGFYMWVTWHLRGSRRIVVEVERPLGQSQSRRVSSVVAARVFKQEHKPTQDATRK
jgi:hypothetical protein